MTHDRANPPLRIAIGADEREVLATVGDPSTEVDQRGTRESLVARWDLDRDGGPAPTTAEITILALFVVFAGARWRLAVLARRPGPVEVAFAPQIGAQDGHAETPDADQAEFIPYYADRFRTHLSASHLYPQTAIPDAGGGEAVIKLIESSSDTGHARLAAGILRVYTLIRPTHAYRVSARLHHRQANPCFGVSLQVEALGGRGSSQVRECWAADWEAAVRQAAHTAAAAILPVTRRLRSGALRSWEGLELNPEVFGQHQLAKAHIQERRYEEAMGLYTELIKTDDPTNTELRFESGTVHEKLEQRIDALDTYLSVITLHPTRTLRGPVSAGQ